MRSKSNRAHASLMTRNNDPVILATSSPMMHEADRLALLVAMPWETQIEWKSKQHQSNDSRGRKTAHCVAYHQ